MALAEGLRPGGAGGGDGGGPITHPTGDALPRPSAIRSALAAYEHQVLLYLRTWRGSIFGAFAQPVLFLLAMGVGLGSYVDASGADATGGVPYLQWLAPALLASTVFQGSAFEATFPIIGGFYWNRRYHAMYATPLSPYAIAFGQIAWTGTRAFVVATAFAIVIVLFGAAATPGIVLAIPVAALTGLAIAGPIAAYMTTQRDTTAFNAIWRFGITPLFLFSGTFFPIESLPPAVQPIAWLLPLWHGVDLCRALTLGTVMDDPVKQAAHLVILVVGSVVGLVAMFVMFRRRLER